ncbi:DeoR/GlpR family DNA-binding transcription regulator [Aerococcus urinae]|uniref:DeoR/GlpR family DNA-binding transcription regulator n=1 Tax=Aerococcus urinae TaxID=1376 RepID=A0A109REB7_9LACT|nr:DeoR/GlpR family DNA-binding transcription regulator [Aerococcus urinae]AMB95616.1 hypothetical protein AWM73_03460 [Aerococcus urinae]MCY3032923.1 DeoR/GlpR family DNA-binding transcription regulator [Aerococcus urinae]MCY3037602.1 DeoR/GlpR family DNA-binding transcription regulator [Aerococcus urinae]MCY3044969.1 DeoR/GlpR family DNA-binding transcription regulator [Aerococcus urinae]MCY3048423.1 DeoR/GlpR family DNA-binding transcription regulator [Aerococcus urinae]
MLTEERQKYIMEALTKVPILNLQEVSKQLAVSESTIRRDFDSLEKAGKLERIHGGAKRVQQRNMEASLSEKSQVNVLEKQLIGKLAGEMVADHDTIYLDSGTTTIEMIPWIINKEIIVVTNGLEVAQALYQSQIHTIVVGGEIKESTGTLIGGIALSQVQSFNFDKAFIGMNGIDLDTGYTTPDIEEAQIKKAAIDHSRYRYILADASKFDQSTFCHVCDLDRAVLLTNESNSKYENYMKIMEVSQ